jgi:hypothetical protein
MLDHLVNMHHVGVFMMEIEEIDLVAQERSVIGAFLDNDAMESLGNLPIDYVFPAMILKITCHCGLLFTFMHALRAKS